MIAIRANRSMYIGLFLGLGLLVLLFTHISFGKAWGVLVQLNGRQLLLPMLATIGSLFLRPWRWQNIFPREARPGFWSCFKVLAIGLMGNNILPARGGDLLRCFLATRQVSLTGATFVLATIGLEKIFDGLAMLAIALFSFLFFSPPQWLTQLELASSFVFVGALAALLLLRYRTAYFLVLTRSFFKKIRLVRLGEKAVALLSQFGKGLSILGSIPQIANAFGLTVLIWAAEAILIWGLALAMQISLSLAAAMVVSAFLGLGCTILPAAPASIGTYEFFSISALSIFGINSESALALTLVMHAWSFIATTIVGLIGCGISGMSFSQLLKSVPVSKELGR